MSTNLYPRMLIAVAMLVVAGCGTESGDAPEDPVLAPEPGGTEQSEPAPGAGEDAAATGFAPLGSGAAAA